MGRRPEIRIRVVSGAQGVWRVRQRFRGIELGGFVKDSEGFRGGGGCFLIKCGVGRCNRLIED
jgi:hypothetical protein